MGLLIGRWRAILVRAVLWATITIFLIVNDGWYGEGWGDFGVALNVIAALISRLATAAGIGVRHRAARRAGGRAALPC
jgi:hypothetical protein